MKVTRHLSPTQFDQNGRTINYSTLISSSLDPDTILNTTLNILVESLKKWQ
jgi:hypothetical protein